MTKPKTEPIPLYGDHMPLEKFIKNCQDGGFIDYDGYGNYATKTEMFSKIVYPSDVLKKGYTPKSEYTHVVWFNR